MILWSRSFHGLSQDCLTHLASSCVHQSPPATPVRTSTSLWTTLLVTSWDLQQKLSAYLFRLACTLPLLLKKLKIQLVLISLSKPGKLLCTTVGDKISHGLCSVTSPIWFEGIQLVTKLICFCKFSKIFKGTPELRKVLESCSSQHHSKQGSGFQHWRRWVIIL